MREVDGYRLIEQEPDTPKFAKLYGAIVFSFVKPVPTDGQFDTDSHAAREEFARITDAEFGNSGRQAVAINSRPINTVPAGLGPFNVYAQPPFDTAEQAEEVINNIKNAVNSANLPFSPVIETPEPLESWDR